MKIKDIYQIILEQYETAASSSEQTKSDEQNNELPISTMSDENDDPLLNSVRPIIGGPIGRFIGYVMTGTVSISLVLAGGVIFGLPFYGEYLQKQKNKAHPAIVQYEPKIMQEKVSPLENIIWEFETKRAINSAVVDSGTIYASTADALYALNAKIGALQWEKNFVEEEFVTSIVPHEDDIFCGGRQGIYVLDAKSGMQKKPFIACNTLNRCISKIDSGNLFFVNEEYDRQYHRKICALDVKTCDAKFLCKGDSMITTSPFAFKDKVYFCTSTGCIHCIDIKTGNQLWKHLWSIKNPNDGARDIEICPDFAANDNSLFVSAHGDLQALDLDTGKPEWLFHPQGIGPYSNFILNGISAPCVSGNSVFVQDSFNLYALDIETGNMKWKADTQRVPFPEFLCKHVPVFNGKRIYVRTTIKNEHNHRIRVYNAETGEKEKVIEFNAEITSNPVFQDNVMYIGINFKNGKHKLLALQ